MCRLADVTHEELLGGRIARIGIALLFLSPVAYFSGAGIVLSADNMRPDRAPDREATGEVVMKWHCSILVRHRVGSAAGNPPIAEVRESQLISSLMWHRDRPCP